MSDWIDVLRDACEQQGQPAIAKQIGYSPGAICSVLKGTYKADTSRIQQAVEGALMQHTVECPLLGDLPRDACVRNQRANKSGIRTTNPMHVQLSRMCPTCTHRRS